MSIRTTSQTLSQRLGVDNSVSVSRRTYRRLFKKHKIRAIRYGIVGANVVVLALVAFFVTNNPDSGSAVRQSALAGASQAEASSPLDQLSSADIAVHAARLTDLPEAVAITNQADSEATQLAITATDNKVVAKPQVVGTSLKSAKDIIVYTTVEGDTLSKLAGKFEITSDSIRWSNGLTSEELPAGKKLLIPPVTGIVYTVKSGDTPASLADRYSSTKEQILSDNDAEVNGLRVGQQILIRGGIQPAVRTYYTPFVRAVYGYNGYDYGYCTWYVANRRAAMGKPIPSNLGNASTWYSRASSAGLGTGRVPVAGAVIWTPPRDYYGHVGLVEEVYPDGSVRISEMNTAGWAVKSEKTLSASAAASYGYIY